MVPGSVQRARAWRRSVASTADSESSAQHSAGGLAPTRVFATQRRPPQAHAPLRSMASVASRLCVAGPRSTARVQNPRRMKKTTTMAAAGSALLIAVRAEHIMPQHVDILLYSCFRPLARFAMTQAGRQRAAPQHQGRVQRESAGGGPAPSSTASNTSTAAATPAPWNDPELQAFSSRDSSRLIASRVRRAAGSTGTARVLVRVRRPPPRPGSAPLPVWRSFTKLFHSWSQSTLGRSSRVARHRAATLRQCGRATQPCRRSACGGASRRALNFGQLSAP